MKTVERHRLRDNEIAEGLHRAGEMWEQNSRPIVQAAGVVVLVGVLALGYWWWQHQRLEQASALLAEARSIASAPLKTPPPAAIPGEPAPPAPVPSPGAFDTEAARRDAALKQYEAAAAAYPSTSAGLEARLHAATAVAFSPLQARPQPWPRDAGLIVVVDGVPSDWIAALPAVTSSSA